ncbi:MAG: hypothetical protein Q9177_004186, partial [Variospora cf. flavescens]
KEYNKIRRYGQDGDRKDGGLVVDTFCLDVRIETGLDGVTAKDDKEDVGNRERDYKDAHAPENGMKSSVREDSTIEEQNRDLGQGQRSDV